MEDNEKQSRESQTQIIALVKDIEHFKYIVKELEKDLEFLKKHFSTKNNERIDDLEKIHKRMDKHIQTELNYHQSIRDKATAEHAAIHKRIGQAERWIWIFFGGFTVIGALLGKASFTGILN